MRALALDQDSARAQGTRRKLRTLDDDFAARNRRRRINAKNSSCCAHLYSPVMKSLSAVSHQLSANPSFRISKLLPALIFPKGFPAKPFVNSFSSYDAGASGV